MWIFTSKNTFVLDDSLVRPFPVASEYSNQVFNSIEDINNEVDTENVIKDDHSDINNNENYTNDIIEIIKNVDTDSDDTENKITLKKRIAEKNEGNKSRKIWISMGKSILNTSISF